MRRLPPPLIPADPVQPEIHAPAGAGVDADDVHGAGGGGGGFDGGHESVADVPARFVLGCDDQLRCSRKGGRKSEHERFRAGSSSTGDNLAGLNTIKGRASVDRKRGRNIDLPLGTEIQVAGGVQSQLLRAAPIVEAEFVEEVIASAHAYAGGFFEIGQWVRRHPARIV